MKKLVLPILFCLILAAGTVLGLALPDRYYSANERRTLKQFPALTAKSLFSGKFGEEIETYLADQFPGRDGWVSAKTVAERLSGKPESGGVSFAADGYLIELHPRLDETQLAANLAALSANTRHKQECIWCSLTDIGEHLTACSSYYIHHVLIVAPLL